MFARSFFLALISAVIVCGCKTKPNATVYQGTGPTVHYHETESAGGPMRKTRYR
jgi:hypothetical protein